MNVIQRFHLNINANSVRQSILYSAGRTGVLRMLKDKHVVVTSNKLDHLHILPPEAKDTEKGLKSYQRVYFVIQVSYSRPHSSLVFYFIVII
jgi:hypothetical protein